MTTYLDPDPSDPWAMQFVIRVEKNNPPTHYAALNALAHAVVDMLYRDEKNTAQTQAVHEWMEGKIRKIVRRARGAAFEKAACLPEAKKYTYKGVEVLAFYPTPVSQAPENLRKLQVSNLDLDQTVTPNSIHPQLHIWLNPHVVMTTGKACAQVGHAAQIACLDVDVPQGEFISVSTPSVTQWDEKVNKNDLAAEINDAGFTEVEPGTLTTLAFWTK